MVAFVPSEVVSDRAGNEEVHIRRTVGHADDRVVLAQTHVGGNRRRRSGRFRKNLRTAPEEVDPLAGHSRGQPHGASPERQDEPLHGLAAGQFDAARFLHADCRGVHGGTSPARRVLAHLEQAVDDGYIPLHHAAGSAVAVALEFHRPPVYGQGTG